MELSLFQVTLYRYRSSLRGLVQKTFWPCAFTLAALTHLYFVAGMLLRAHVGWFAVFYSNPILQFLGFLAVLGGVIAGLMFAAYAVSDHVQNKNKSASSALPSQASSGKNQYPEFLAITLAGASGVLLAILLFGLFLVLEQGITKGAKLLPQIIHFKATLIEKNQKFLEENPDVSAKLMARKLRRSLAKASKPINSSKSRL